MTNSVKQDQNGKQQGKQSHNRRHPPTPPAYMRMQSNPSTQTTPHQKPKLVIPHPPPLPSIGISTPPLLIPPHVLIITAHPPACQHFHRPSPDISTSPPLIPRHVQYSPLLPRYVQISSVHSSACPHYHCSRHPKAAR